MKIQKKRRKKEEKDETRRRGVIQTCAETGQLFNTAFKLIVCFMSSHAFRVHVAPRNRAIELSEVLSFVSVHDHVVWKMTAQICLRWIEK